MKRLLPSLSLSLWLLCCCAVSAQVPNGGANGVPNAAPFVGFSTVAKSGAASSHTGDTSEFALATVTLPALGANGQIRINAYWTVTNNANVKNIRVRLGGTGVSGTSVFSAGPTTVGSVMSYTMVINANATNSQVSFSEVARGTDGLVITPASSTAAVDMTQSQILVFTGQDAVGTDTITLSGYTVETIN